MTRLNVVLLLAVLASAIYLVHTQYESRRLFTELDRAVAEGRALGRSSKRCDAGGARERMRRTTTVGDGKEPIARDRTAVLGEIAVFEILVIWACSSTSQVLAPSS